MKEITIRIYDGDDPSVIDAVNRMSKINFFDLFIDGEVYSNMEHLTLNITAPKARTDGVLDVDQTKVSVSIDKNFPFPTNCSPGC